MIRMLSTSKQCIYMQMWFLNVVTISFLQLRTSFSYCSTGNVRIEEQGTKNRIAKIGEEKRGNQVVMKSGIWESKKKFLHLRNLTSQLNKIPICQGE